MTSDSTQGTFIVTLSLAYRLGMLASRHFLVPAPRSSVMLSFNSRFCRMMRRLSAPYSLRVIDSYRLMDTLKKKAHELMARDRNKVILNICADMTVYIGGRGLAVNRLYNPFGVCMGHGPRPGNPSINVQLDSLASYLSGKSIILIEDGIFTGGSLEFVLAKLIARGHRVSDVLIGFCKLGAEEALKRGINGRVKVMYKFDQVIDWLPSHDLIPLVPYSGRVFGYQDESGEMSPLTYDGFSHSYPYIEPFGMMGEWAGVSLAAAEEISRFGLFESIKLFKCMERMNGRPVLVRDLIRKHCVSLPLQINKLVDPTNVHVRVVDYLREVTSIFEKSHSDRLA